MKTLLEALLGSAIITSGIALFIWLEWIFINWCISMRFTSEQFAMTGVGVLFVVIAIILFLKGLDE